MAERFKRTEKKYLLSLRQYQKLTEILSEKTRYDRFGRYPVFSVYFDDDNFSVIKKSLEKPIFKVKLRLRSYGLLSEGDICFMELKSKYKGVVYKRRITVPFNEYENAAQAEVEAEGKDLQTAREINYFAARYRLYPKVFISYNREAFYSEEGLGLRITFDTDINYRTYLPDLRRDLPCEGGILEQGQRLMEIKAPRAVPLWLTKAMEDGGIYPCSFSKYGRVYKDICLNQQRRLIKNV